MNRMERSPEFKRRLQKKSPPEVKAILKALQLMEQDLNYPSLNTHPLHDVFTPDGKRIYDVSATKKLRITFHYRDDGVLRLRMNCQHDKVLRNP